MIEFVVGIILYILATEAITDILVNSDIIQPFKKFLYKNKDKVILYFLHELFDCAYCMSVWVSFILLISSLNFFNITTFISFIVLWMVIHKVAFILHNTFLRYVIF